MNILLCLAFIGRCLGEEPSIPHIDYVEPAKEQWAQAMIAHVWSKGESLTLNPASGIKDDQLVTTRYNDFDNLRWLGNKPASRFRIHATEEAGRCVCVEARVKLNTPGEKDGENQLWIDGKLEAERIGLDWRGRFAKTGINAVFLESYWNIGSPVDQSRWIDHFVISRQPIGPLVCTDEPVVMKTPYAGPGEQLAWQLEVADGPEGKKTVWKSDLIGNSDRLTLTDATGKFTVSNERFQPGAIYFIRIRQQSTNAEWSDWSSWHQPFRIK